MINTGKRFRIDYDDSMSTLNAIESINNILESVGSIYYFEVDQEPHDGYDVVNLMVLEPKNPTQISKDS